MAHALPALAALCMTVYWTTVIVKLVRLGHKLRKDPNAIPREPVGQLMRVLWYPVILVLLVALFGVAIPNFGGALRSLVGRWMQPLASGLSWLVAGWLAMTIATLCTIFTFICWRKMGRSWRIGIDPGETLDLVSTGPYRWVRHPIYSLRMVINLCIMVAAPVPLVILTAGLDMLLLQIEARREERYMESTHGQTYAAYKKNVGRFVPRWRVV